MASIHDILDMHGRRPHMIGLLYTLLLLLILPLLIFSTNGVMSGCITPMNGSILLLTLDGSLSLLNPRNGELYWTLDSGGPIIQILSGDVESFNSQPLHAMWLLTDLSGNLYIKGNLHGVEDVDEVDLQYRQYFEHYSSGQFNKLGFTLDQVVTASPIKLPEHGVLLGSKTHSTATVEFPTAQTITPNSQPSMSSAPIPSGFGQKQNQHQHCGILPIRLSILRTQHSILYNREGSLRTGVVFSSLDLDIQPSNSGPHSPMHHTLQEHSELETLSSPKIRFCRDMSCIYAVSPSDNQHVLWHKTLLTPIVDVYRFRYALKQPQHTPAQSEANHQAAYHFRPSELKLIPVVRHGLVVAPQIKRIIHHFNAPSSHSTHPQDATFAADAADPASQSLLSMSTILEHSGKGDEEDVTDATMSETMGSQSSTSTTTTTRGTPTAETETETESHPPAFCSYSPSDMNRVMSSAMASRMRTRYASCIMDAAQNAMKVYDTITAAVKPHNAMDSLLLIDSPSSSSSSSSSFSFHHDNHHISADMIDMTPYSSNNALAFADCTLSTAQNILYAPSIQLVGFNTASIHTHSHLFRTTTAPSSSSSSPVSQAPPPLPPAVSTSPTSAPPQLLDVPLLSVSQSPVDHHDEEAITSGDDGNDICPHKRHSQYLEYLRDQQIKLQEQIYLYTAEIKQQEQLQQLQHQHSTLSSFSQQNENMLDNDDDELIDRQLYTSHSYPLQDISQSQSSLSSSPSLLQDTSSSSGQLVPSMDDTSTTLSLSTFASLLQQNRFNLTQTVGDGHFVIDTNGYIHVDFYTFIEFMEKYKEYNPLTHSLPVIHTTTRGGYAEEGDSDADNHEYYDFDSAYPSHTGGEDHQGEDGDPLDPSQPMNRRQRIALRSKKWLQDRLVHVEDNLRAQLMMLLTQLFLTFLHLVALVLRHKAIAIIGFVMFYIVCSVSKQREQYTNLVRSISYVNNLPLPYYLMTPQEQQKLLLLRRINKQQQLEYHRSIQFSSSGSGPASPDGPLDTAISSPESTSFTPKTVPIRPVVIKFHDFHLDAHGFTHHLTDIGGTIAKPGQLAVPHTPRIHHFYPSRYHDNDPYQQQQSQPFAANAGSPSIIFPYPPSGDMLPAPSVNLSNHHSESQERGAGASGTGTNAIQLPFPPPLPFITSPNSSTHTSTASSSALGENDRKPGHKRSSSQSISTPSTLTPLVSPIDAQPSLLVFDGFKLPIYQNRFRLQLRPFQGIIGKGGFGKVRVCEDVMDGGRYAVKQIIMVRGTGLFNTNGTKTSLLDGIRSDPSRSLLLSNNYNISIINDDSQWELVLREARALARLDHQHIVRYYHCWIEPLQLDALWGDDELGGGANGSNTNNDSDDDEDTMNLVANQIHIHDNSSFNLPQFDHHGNGAAGATAASTSSTSLHRFPSSTVSSHQRGRSKQPPVNSRQPHGVGSHSPHRYSLGDRSGGGGTGLSSSHRGLSAGSPGAGGGRTIGNASRHILSPHNYDPYDASVPISSDSDFISEPADSDDDDDENDNRDFIRMPTISSPNSTSHKPRPGTFFGFTFETAPDSDNDDEDYDEDEDEDEDEDDSSEVNDDEASDHLPIHDRSGSQTRSRSNSNSGYAHSLFVRGGEDSSDSGSDSDSDSDSDVSISPSILPPPLDDFPMAIPPLSINSGASGFQAQGRSPFHQGLKKEVIGASTHSNQEQSTPQLVLSSTQTQQHDHNSSSHLTTRSVSSFDSSNSSHESVHESDGGREIIAADSMSYQGEFGSRRSPSSVDPAESLQQHGLLLYIQMQYCAGGTLRTFLDQRSNVNPLQSSYLLEQILLGLHHIHSHGLVHRDIKPDNILFDEPLHIRIGDFGLCTQYSLSPPPGALDTHTMMSITSSSDSTANHLAAAMVPSPQQLESIGELSGGVGSYLYAAPEQIKGGRYSNKADMYSLGIIILELFTHFTTQSQRIHTVYKARAGHIDLPDKALQAICMKLLSPQEQHRYSAEDILKSAWMKEQRLAIYTQHTWFR